MAGLADGINIVPSLEPGVYPSAVGVTLNVPTAGVEAITYSLDTRPSIGKVLAKDQYGNPYVAVVEDGLGRVYFDGGFPKYYDSLYSTAWTQFSQLNSAHKLLYNALNWVHNVTKPKKLLIITDVNSGNYYSFGPNACPAEAFKYGIPKTAQMAGFTQVDVISWSGAMMDVPISVLEQYSVCLLMGSSGVNVNRFSANLVNNLCTFRENNNGLVVITDHNVFQQSVNAVCTRFGVTFYGDVNRTTGAACYSLNYIKTTYGDHPLWNNLDGYLWAGGSEGGITLTQSPAYTGQTVSITNCYHILYALVKATDGSISVKAFPYAIGVTDPVTWSSSIQARTIKNTVDVNQFSVTPINGQTTKGVVKYKGRVAGVFESSPGVEMKQYYSGSTVALEIGENSIDIEIKEPLAFYSHKKITRDPLVKTVSCGRTTTGFLIDEAAGGKVYPKITKRLNAVKQVIGVPKNHKLTHYIDNIANYGKATGLIKRVSNITVLGDSIAQSWPMNCADAPATLASEPEDRRAWTAKTAMLTGHIIKNRGIGGNICEEMLARFDSDVTPTNPSYVVLVAGANNYVRNKEDVSVVMPKIEALLNKIESIGAIPIMTCYMNTNEPAYAAAWPGLKEYFRALNPKLTALASSRGYLMINWYGALSMGTDFVPDGLHPNAAGYYKMAKVAAQVLSTL